ncbi:MAG: HAD-IIA family hydrolase [Halobacteriales archaeon]
MPVYNGAIIDLDGTVVRGNQLLPGAKAAIGSLRDRGVELLFVSNNPVDPPARRVDQLRDLGLEVDTDEVMTSGTMTAAYLLEAYPEADTYLIGEDGLRTQLADAGVTLTDVPEQADVVVGSIDRTMSYESLTEGLQAVVDGTPYIGTDPDGTIPGSDGVVLPGTGCMLGALRGMLDRDPVEVLGKPSEFGTEMALDRLGVAPEECLVIGDRLDTDIAMGTTAGMTTVLVLTGVAGRSDVENAKHPAPDFILESFAEIDRLLTP